MTAGSPRERVERLLALTRSLVAQGAPEREGLCRRWAETTGLSPRGVEWALDHCLELEPSEAEIGALLASVPRVARAHVILPAQVFTAAQRALALALAAAPEVYVRPSRRDPTLITALSSSAGELFECSEQLGVRPGDHVWAYGADLTLGELRQRLPPGAILHAHGSGFGAAVLGALPAPGPAGRARLAEQVRALADDTLCFDQRGCLSPRLVFIEGGVAASERVQEALLEALADAGRRVPRGRLTLDELAEETWYRRCAECFGPVLDSGHGTLVLRAGDAALSGAALPGGGALQLPPAGRHLQIVPVERLEPALAGLEPWLTSVGCADPALEVRVRAVLPRVRVSELGRMQSPAFDGPVDRRVDLGGELIQAAAVR